MNGKNKIITELYDHIGNTVPATEIVNRNIYKGTEVEFVVDSPSGEMFITGVVEECYYDTSEFVINSFHRDYTIPIKDITKILNSNKYRTNINKLNNIDFL